MEGLVLNRLILYSIWSCLLISVVMTTESVEDEQHSDNDIVVNPVFTDPYEQLNGDDNIHILDGDRALGVERGIGSNSANAFYILDDPFRSEDHEELLDGKRKWEDIPGAWKGFKFSKRNWKDDDSFMNEKKSWEYIGNFRKGHGNRYSGRGKRQSDETNNYLNKVASTKRDLEDIRSIWPKYSNGNEAVGKRGWEDIRSNLLTGYPRHRVVDKRAWEDVSNFWRSYRVSDNKSVGKRGWEDIRNLWKLQGGSNIGKRGWEDIRNLWKSQGSSNIGKRGWEDIRNLWKLQGSSNIGKRGWEDIRNLWKSYSSSNIGKRGWEDIRNLWKSYSSSNIGKRGWEDIRNLWKSYGRSNIGKRGWEDIRNLWKSYSSSSIGKRGWEDIRNLWKSQGSSNIGKRGWEDIRNLWKSYSSSNIGKRGWEDIRNLWKSYGSSKIGKRGWEDIRNLWKSYGKSNIGKRGLENLHFYWNINEWQKGKQGLDDALWKQYNAGTIDNDKRVIGETSLFTMLNEINRPDNVKSKRAWEVVDRIWNLPVVRKYLRSGKRSKEELVDIPVQPSGQSGPWMIDEVGYNLKDGIPVKDWDTFYYGTPTMSSEENDHQQTTPECDCCKDNPVSSCCVRCALQSKPDIVDIVCPIENCMLKLTFT